VSHALHILIAVDIYVILALSLNLLVGYAGMVSLCHAVFYGVGAYVGGLLMSAAGGSFFVALPAAFGAGVLCSFVVSVPATRLKGDFFALATIGFQVVFFTVLYNWTEVTNGPYGVGGITRPGPPGHFLRSPLGYWLLCTLVCALAVACFSYLGRTPFGMVLKAIREREVAAATVLSRELQPYKILAFALAAGFAAVAGVLYAGYAGFIDPTSFTLTESIFILSVIVIGGAGNVVGPVAGAVLLVCLPELLRYLNVPDSVGAQTRQMVYGALILLLMRFRPRGLLGEYQFK
jgi:branched-chain amino acid transport system permease protein